MNYRVIVTTKDNKQQSNDTSPASVVDRAILLASNKEKCTGSNE